MSAPPTERLTAMGFICNPDGSVTRAFEAAPVTPPSSNLDEPNQVLFKDVPLNPSTSTSLRLFLPRTALHATGTTKMPIIIYAHGGGFIILRAASTICHQFCSSIALKTPALIISVDYRLAPEHRLPAAFDDYMEALHWVKTTKDEWLTQYADLSNCYLMGSSAGGNIVFHSAVRAADCANELKPLKINGLILHQPFFGGVERTASEIKSGDSMTLPLCLSDVMWELALPEGCDRDHEYSNPVNQRNLEIIKEKGWKVTVTGCNGDTLYDRQMEMVKALEVMGASVASKFVEGEYHGYDILEPSKGALLFSAINQIVKFTNRV